MKKFISIILTAILILSTVSIGASAVPEINHKSVMSKKVDIISFDPSTKMEYYDEAKVISANNFYSTYSNANTPYMFYSFLDADQKSVYNAILRNPFEYEYSVPLSKSIEGNCYLDENYDAILTAEMQSEIVKIFLGGVSAVSEDNPMLFWILYSMSFGYSYSYYNVGNNLYHIIIDSIIIANYDLAGSPYTSLVQVNELYNQLETAVNEFNVTGKTRFEKVKSIHDGIGKLATYDPNYDNENKNPTDHEPVSTLLSPYTTVCEGYAESFKLLCDREGIPCIVVVGVSNGGGHAWNYVKMDDNNWYAVDLTWDDTTNPSGNIYYDFFLMGANSTNKHFGGNTTFSQAHTPTGRRYVSDLFSLTYPILSPTAYCRVMLNANSTATYNAEGSLLFYSPKSTIDASFTVPYGYTKSLTGTGATGSVLTATNSQGVANSYTVIMRGDIVPDAKANINDYNRIKSALSGNELPANSPEYKAADLNSDENVDVFDAFEMNLYLAGKKDF